MKGSEREIMEDEGRNYSSWVHPSEIEGGMGRQLLGSTISTLT